MVEAKSSAKRVEECLQTEWRIRSLVKACPLTIIEQ